MMNPMQVLKDFLGKGGNPQELVLRTISMNNSNPMINNLVNMAKENNPKAIEIFARNYMKERGMDFDKEFNLFMNNFKQGTNKR